jgi:DNA-binding CsgD family transcriptional regulator
VLTGTADLEAAIAAINQAEVFRFYTKPCAAGALAAGIGEALAHGAARRPAAPPSPEAAFGLATLDRLPTGVAVVDREAKVLFMNRSGAEYLAKGDGFSVSPTGICRAQRPAKTAELHRLIQTVVDDTETAPPKAISLGRASEGRPLSVVVARLRPRAEAEKVAVLLISDPDRQELPSLATIGQLFELTETEARLALHLAEGLRVEEAAAAMGITVSSARTYLKRVFGKTGVTRQAELVRLIIAAPTLMGLGGRG